MGYSDLCKGRASIPRQIYFVTVTTQSRTPWFKELGAARLVVKEMRGLHSQGDVDSLAWVLMPDHLHWLIQLGSDMTLSGAMRKLKGRSTASIRNYRNVSAKIWQRGFHEHAVRREENIVAIARYIVANPLRAGLVSSLRDYPLWDAKWLDMGVSG